MRLPFLGRRSGGPPDPRRELLGDIAGPAREVALALLARLTADRRAAEAEVELLDDMPDDDAIFLHVAEATGAIVVIDWADGCEAIRAAVDGRLAALGKPAIGAGDAQWIARYVANAWRERGDAMGLAYGPLAHCL